MSINTSGYQRQILVNFMREHGSVTTTEARELLGIMSPATRIKELRNMGYEIITERVKLTDDLNITHPNVARYILIKEPVA